MVVGGQPRSVEDVDRLAAEGITAIHNLQEDKDVHHWGVDLPALQHRASLKGIEVIRTPVSALQGSTAYAPHSLCTAPSTHRRYPLPLPQAYPLPLFPVQAVDFDPNSLRATLPAAAAALQRARERGKRVYVHCTAGLGRSPAAAIAALYWFEGMQLDEAYSYLTSIRWACRPAGQD